MAGRPAGAGVTGPEQLKAERDAFTAEMQKTNPDLTQARLNRLYINVMLAQNFAPPTGEYAANQNALVIESVEQDRLAPSLKAHAREVPENVRETGGSTEEKSSAVQGGNLDEILANVNNSVKREPETAGVSNLISEVIETLYTNPAGSDNTLVTNIINSVSMTVDATQNSGIQDTVANDATSDAGISCNSSE